MDLIFEELKCLHCKKYLSVFPIKVYPNRQVKCGRCSANDDGGTISKLYETIAQELKFPCVNRYEGCKKLLEPREVVAHENVCLGTLLQCPICYNFEAHSLQIVEHFKEKHFNNYIKHPEFLIPFNEKNEEIFYLYADDMKYSLGIVCVRYDDIVNMLYLDIAPICRDPENSKSHTQKFELYSINNSLVFKSSKKICESYVLHNRRNINNRFAVYIKEKYPNKVAMCKFFINESTEISFKSDLVQESTTESKTVVQELYKLWSRQPLKPPKFVEPCKLQHFPSIPEFKTVIKEVHKPCNLRHYPLEPTIIVGPCELKHFPDDYIMPLDINNRGCQTIRCVFKDVYILRDQDELVSPLFYVGNTSWKISIKYNHKKNTPYLSLFLYKEKCKEENGYSYKVSAEIGLLKYGAENKNAFSLGDRIFGMRSNESMNWGWPEFIPWSILLDPHQNYYVKDDEDEDARNIRVEIKITLLDIFKHTDYCWCPDCV